MSRGKFAEYFATVSKYRSILLAVRKKHVQSSAIFKGDLKILS